MTTLEVILRSDIVLFAPRIPMTRESFWCHFKRRSFVTVAEVTGKIKTAKILWCFKES